MSDLSTDFRKYFSSRYQLRYVVNQAARWASARELGFVTIYKDEQNRRIDMFGDPARVGADDVSTFEVGTETFYCSSELIRSGSPVRGCLSGPDAHEAANIALSGIGLSLGVGVLPTSDGLSLEAAWLERIAGIDERCYRFARVESPGVPPVSACFDSQGVLRYQMGRDGDVSLELRSIGDVALPHPVDFELPYPLVGTSGR